MTPFLAYTEETLASLTKQRPILNVRKKKRVVHGPSGRGAPGPGQGVL